MILPASYANGFAPRDGQPLYPELQNAVIGAFAPCLGPTGIALRDWSKFKNNGTLTSMDVSTDWTIGAGRYALDFDGTNDYVSVPDNGLRPSEISFSAWVIPAATPANFDSVYTWQSGNRGAIFTFMNTSKFRVYVRSAAGYTSVDSVNTVSAGVLVHVCGYISTASQTIGSGTNGKIEATTSWSGTISYGTLGIAGQIGQYDGNGFAQLQLLDLMLYGRVLSGNEFRLLGRRPGIAYELAPRRRSSVQVAAFNRRRRLLIGASS